MTEGARRKGLGRGLAALIDDIKPEARGDAPVAETLVPIERIRPNPDQPRKRFDESELDALAASIAEKGVIQPLIVRPARDGSEVLDIVAGERRWRAAQKARLHELPVLIRDLDDQGAAEIALIENIQRADLNPVEEAAGYARLIERHGHTQERLATALGRSRSAIANALRLLTLPEIVLDMLRDGVLSAGHARALIGAADPAALARQVAERGLSVRDVEKLVKAPEAAKPAKPSRAETDPDTAALEADLSAAVGLKVAIRHARDGAGELRIRYKSLDDLDGLCQLLSR